jgi:regulator of protease activity HflC (stomatin/prohibitin superfamily)
MSIDTIIAEKIADASVIAINRVLTVTIKPLIKDIFDNEISKKIEDIIDDKASDIDNQVEGLIDEVVERHVDDKVQEAVDNYMGDIDWSDHIGNDIIEAAVSDHLENNTELDEIVEAAVKERTDNRLYEVVNDAVNDMDVDNIISDRRIELVVDAALPAAVANYMDGKLSNYFRSPEGEKVLSDFLVSHAGRTCLARTLLTVLLEHSNA